MSLQDFLLANHLQPVPAWLEGFDPNRPPTGNELVRSFLASRIVFYPGSGQDGSTVQVFNEGHAAQCFLYVDYGMTRAAVLTELEERGFSGYRPIANIDLLESDFPTGRWERHIEPGEVQAPPPPVAPYAFLAILEKQPGSHATGADRLAILFLAADGHATYDALFCQRESGPLPFCVVLQDHGFGRNHSPWGAGGLMERIAGRTACFPDYLLVGDNTNPWIGYHRLEGIDPIVVEGGRQRFLYGRMLHDDRVPGDELTPSKSGTSEGTNPMFNEYVRHGGELFQAIVAGATHGMPAFANYTFQMNPGLPDRLSMRCGAGLYFITYRGVPIYIGKFLGHIQDAFAGVLFSARWLRHISTLSLRGRRISISMRLQSWFTSLNPHHEISVQIAAANAALLAKDRGFQVAGNRLMFAAVNWPVLREDPKKWLHHFTFGYVQLNRAYWRGRGFTDEAIWNPINAAERRAIGGWRPQANGEIREAATAAAGPEDLVRSLKAILQRELEGEVAPADLPVPDEAQPLQAEVRDFRGQLNADHEEAKDAFREGLPEGSPTAVVEAIINALQDDLATEVHYTMTNGGDLRVRVLDVARPRNVFTIYWQIRRQRFFGRALVPVDVLAHQTGVTEAAVCPAPEPLWSRFTVDCSEEGAPEAVSEVVRLAVENLRAGVPDPREP